MGVKVQFRKPAVRYLNDQQKAMKPKEWHGKK